ncbi:uncharacterized protein LOC114350441 [Ostrinia furnacalis]|uniref:uncharacterized protein LOC114350441 n=1 Tax=Ostrinia furnacalis TaxID=93504 RepID=UPI00103E9566|nr:uncharacterized protein LOC114350441 [Ostrinia furnacalis]
MNVSGNEVGKLEIGHLGDLKRYYDLNHATHQTPTANIWALTTENAIHRQGDPPGPPGPPDNYPDKPPPWLHPNYWGTTTTRATATTTTTAVPPSVEEEPPSLLLPFQKAMDLYRMGYFSVFVSLGSHIVSEKSFNDVRLLSMSLEREFHRLHDDDKHILGFGEPFLGAFEHFVKQMGQLPADYIKSQAQILQHSIHFRREYFADQLNSLMDYIDSLYNEDEGVALVQSLDALNLFPKNTWNSYEILRNISDSLFAPYKRLAGTVKRELLVESLNDFLEKVGYTLLGDKNIFGVLNITDARRNYSNKTRFAVVGRETSGKTRQTDTRLSNTPRSVTNIKRETYDAEKKLREINTKIKNAAVKIRKVTRKEPTAVPRSQPTYHTTQQKPHVRLGFKEKHPKIYDKYLQLKKKAHKKHRKKEKFREFKKRYFGNMFPKLHGYERYSKMKAEKLKNKLLLNISDTDFDGEYLSDSESYDSDFSAIVYKMKQAKTKFKDFNKGRQSTLRVSASKSPSNKISRTKKSSQFTQKSHKTAKIMKITKTSKAATKRIHSDINISHSTIENNAVAAKTNILKKLNEKLNKLTNELGIEKSRLNKISLKPTKIADSQVNKTNKSSAITTIDFTTVKFKSVTAKNKIAALSSYSDEEDVLKFKISDAMRHDKPFLIPQRRLNNFRQRFKKDIDVSYSSDEVVLKSKIYQSLGFQNFSKLNEVRRRANNDIDEVKVKKIRFQKFKPVNEISSYSDEEDTLKEKLKL